MRKSPPRKESEEERIERIIDEKFVFRWTTCSRCGYGIRFEKMYKGLAYPNPNKLDRYFLARVCKKCAPDKKAAYVLFKNWGALH